MSAAETLPKALHSAVADQFGDHLAGGLVPLAIPLRRLASSPSTATATAFKISSNSVAPRGHRP
jgi:hypothetical protein